MGNCTCGELYFSPSGKVVGLVNLVEDLGPVDGNRGSTGVLE